MNKECQNIEPLLEKYLDGDLRADQVEVVKAHLELCSACREVTQQQQLLQASLGALPQLTCPPSLEKNIARVTRAPGQERRAPFWLRAFCHRWGWRVVPAGAAALAITALLFFSIPDRQPAGLDAQYSPAEIAAARQKAKLSLALALQIVNRSEREAVAEVFGKQFPRAVRQSLRKVISTPEGGQG